MINSEIEATFIDIDKDALRAKLKTVGAELIQPEILMRRTIFDVDEHSFARVRDEGNKITMSYKHLDELSLSGMKEACVEVNDFQEAVNILQALGHKIKAEQEALREEWLLNGVKVDIDTWPWLPSYVEIEGSSEESVKNVATKLGFDMKDAYYGSVDRIYQVYYDVTDADINYCPEIKFTNIPDWLSAKRRPEAKK